MTLTKYAKDFVADALMGIAAGLATVTVTSIDEAIAMQAVITFAIVKALVQAVYRTALKWATTQ